MKNAVLPTLVHSESRLGFTGRIYRGGQPRGLVAELVKDGITDVVCFQSGWYDWFNELLNGKRPRTDELRAEVEAHGLSFHEMPLSDFRAPTLEQTRSFIIRCDLAMASNRRIYIHCLHGVDRTGWMSAAHRVVRQGWYVDDAIAEWMKMGHHSRWYFWWRGSFRKLMNRWGYK